MNKWGVQIRKDGLVSVLFIKEAKEKKLYFATWTSSQTLNITSLEVLPNILNGVDTRAARDSLEI